MSWFLDGSEKVIQAFDWVGRMMFPILMLLIVLDVLGRRLFALPTVAIQEAEWHAHGVLFLLTIAAAYLRDNHVRVEVLRDSFSPRTKRVIEVAGCLLFLLPYMLLVGWIGVDFTIAAYESGEGSSAAEGLGNRWIVKTFMPIGFALMALSALVVAARTLQRRNPGVEAAPPIVSGSSANLR